jgi:hypothetical protein
LGKKFHVAFTATAQEALHDGFGPKESSEDLFDAFVALPVVNPARSAIFCGTPPATRPSAATEYQTLIASTSLTG